MIASELAVESPLPALGGTTQATRCCRWIFWNSSFRWKAMMAMPISATPFAEAAARGGELLFDLPAEGLMDDCKRIAVLRIPSATSDMRIVLAVLDQNGTDIRMESPAPETAHLVQFADAFIEVLERF
jgi:hypothetical protein